MTVKNKATSVATSTTTDASGYYNFASLPVGAYTMEVELQSFKKAVHENVNLEVGQRHESISLSMWARSLKRLV